MNKQQTRNLSNIADKVKNKKDSSDISSYDSDVDNKTHDDIKSEATKNYIETELVERITKYLKIDTMMKDKQKEVREFMKQLKKQKEEMEKYILGYLDEIDEQFIKIDGQGKLIKSTSVSKGAINADNIKKSVTTSVVKTNLRIDNEKFNELLQNILENIEENRPKTTRKYIKRVKERDTKKNNKKDTENITDDELPKY